MIPVEGTAIILAALVLGAIWNEYLHRNGYGAGSRLPALWTPNRKRGQTWDDWFPAEAPPQHAMNRRRSSRRREPTGVH